MEGNHESKFDDPINQIRSDEVRTFMGNHYTNDIRIEQD